MKNIEISKDVKQKTGIKESKSFVGIVAEPTKKDTVPADNNYDRFGVSLHSVFPH